MKKGLKISMWVALGFLAVILFGWVTMALWNWLVPDLFNGPEITFWQALGLFILSKIIFGFGGKGGGHKGGHWRHHYYKEKLAGMSPEDRERFKAKVREKWCYPDPETSKENKGTSNV